MAPVVVLVLAPAPRPAAGPHERLLDAAREALAERHRAGFLAAGAARVEVRREPPDDTPFGARLRRLAAELGLAGSGAGLVVLGAGALPLATARDRLAFVEAAATEPVAARKPVAARGPTVGAPEPLEALANQRYSADAVAIPRAGAVLHELPDAITDNGLPRWLEEVAGLRVRDLRARRALAIDVDSPLDLLLLDGAPGAPILPLPPPSTADPVRERLARLRGLARDPGAELLVAGRMSADDVRWLERGTRSRSRALIEERGLATAATGALVGRANRRPPRSVLGTLLDRDGPDSLGRHLATLADGALVDSRVLLAHRLGAAPAAWPPPEDRFASDLLLAGDVRDPWLRELTAAAAAAPIPVLLGGHALVGPGARLALRPPRRAAAR